MSRQTKDLFADTLDTNGDILTIGEKASEIILGGSSTDVTITKQICVTAYRRTSIDIDAGNGITVIFNESDSTAYNTTTGIFTVPETGKYHIKWVLCIASRVNLASIQNISAGIVKGSLTTALDARCLPEASTDPTKLCSLHCCVILDCQKDDTLSVVYSTTFNSTLVSFTTTKPSLNYIQIRKIS